MTVTTITVGRVFNTGNFTSKRFEATAAILPSEDLADAVFDLYEALTETALPLLADDPGADQTLHDAVISNLARRKRNYHLDD